MKIFDIYIFNKIGETIWHKSYHPNDGSLMQQDKDEYERLLYGLIFTLKHFVRLISPAKELSEKTDGNNSIHSRFKSFSTTKYSLNYFETLTGLKFICTTDPEANSLEVQKHLFYIYSKLYVPFVAKNPLANLGGIINAKLFVDGVEKYVNENMSISRIS